METKSSHRKHLLPWILIRIRNSNNVGIRPSTELQTGDVESGELNEGHSSKEEEGSEVVELAIHGTLVPPARWGT